MECHRSEIQSKEKKGQGERREKVKEKPDSETPSSASCAESGQSLQERPFTVRQSPSGKVHQHRESISLPERKHSKRTLEEPVERRRYPPTHTLKDTRGPEEDTMFDDPAESKEETDQQSDAEYMSTTVSSEKLDTSETEQRSRGSRSSRVSLPVVETQRRARRQSAHPQSITMSESVATCKYADVIVHETGEKAKNPKLRGPARKAVRNLPSKPSSSTEICPASSPDEKQSGKISRVVYTTKSYVEEALRQSNSVSVTMVPVAEVQAPEDTPKGSSVTKKPVIQDPGLPGPDMILVYEDEPECDPGSRLSPTHDCERDLASCVVERYPSLKPYELTIGRGLTFFYGVIAVEVLVIIGILCVYVGIALHQWYTGS